MTRDSGLELLGSFTARLVKWLRLGYHKSGGPESGVRSLKITLQGKRKSNVLFYSRFQQSDSRDSRLVLGKNPTDNF